MAPLFCVLFVALSLSAGAAVPLRLMLAVPESSGRISLGVFNPEGKLIRTLCESRDVETFEIGLNGLILTWDGLSAEGKPAKPGKYLVRGWFIPEGVVVEGEAFHFNSWEDAAGIPPLSKVLGAIPTGGEEFFLVGTDAAENRGAVWKADARGVLSVRRFLPEGTEFLAGEQRMAVLRTPTGLAVFSLEGEEKLEPVVGEAALAAVSSVGVALVAGGGSELVLHNLTQLASEPLKVPLPITPKFLTAGGGGFLVSDGLRVARVEGGKVTEVPLGDPVILESLAPGVGDSFWMSGVLQTDPPQPVVRNFSFAGELLREWKLEPSEARNLVISSPRATGFFLLSDHHGVTTFRGLRPLAGPVAVNTPATPGSDDVRITDWEEFLVRTIEPCEAFGFADGQPAASAPANDLINIPLAEDPLSSRPGTISLRLAFDTTGAWLESEEGLSLLPIWDATRIQRVAVAPGKATGSLQILVGQPGFAAGFFAGGLQKISPLEGGEVEVLP
ncbi:MAG: hypothetical protein WEB60_03690 [Terrimicrobiaceae bacterium]